MYVNIYIYYIIYIYKLDYSAKWQKTYNREGGEGVLFYRVCCFFVFSSWIRDSFNQNAGEFGTCS
jgi:hypothetical protein